MDTALVAVTLFILCVIHVYPELWSGDELRSVAVGAEIDFPWSGDHSRLITGHLS